MAKLIAIFLDPKNITEISLPKYVINLEAVGPDGYHIELSTCKNNKEECIICDFIDNENLGIRGVDYELIDWDYLNFSDYKFYDEKPSKLECQIDECNDENCHLKSGHILLASCKEYKIKDKTIYIYTDIKYIKND